jgi:bisphosphoglycerate-independent phosphoglycerate mutase (AlkP superfamily)
MLITADHGNAEQMVNPKTGEVHTAHTNNLGMISKMTSFVDLVIV